MSGLAENVATVPCPRCDASAGELCALQIGKPARWARVHIQRLDFFIGRDHDPGDEDRS